MHSLRVLSPNVNIQFIEAVKRWDVEKARKLLEEQKADVNAKDQYGMTALMWLAIFDVSGLLSPAVEKYSQMLRLLKPYNPDPNIQDLQGNTALMFFSSFLPNTPATGYRMTSADFECESRMCEFARTFEAELKFDIPNNAGQTPMAVLNNFRYKNNSAYQEVVKIARRQLGFPYLVADLMKRLSSAASADVGQQPEQKSGLPAEVQQLLSCPISMEYMAHPVLLKSGHTLDAKSYQDIRSSAGPVQNKNPLSPNLKLDDKEDGKPNATLTQFLQAPFSPLIDAFGNEIIDAMFFPGSTESFDLRSWNEKQQQVREHFESLGLPANAKPVKNYLLCDVIGAIRPILDKQRAKNLSEQKDFIEHQKAEAKGDTLQTATNLHHQHDFSSAEAVILGEFKNNAQQLNYDVGYTYLLLLADTYFRLSEFEKSIECYKSILVILNKVTTLSAPEKISQSSQINLKIGDMQRILGRSKDPLHYQQAAESYNQGYEAFQASVMQPSPDLFYTLGTLLENKIWAYTSMPTGLKPLPEVIEQTIQALDDFSKSFLQEYSNDPRAHLLRAKFLFLKDEYTEEAIVHAKTAYDLIHQSQQHVDLLHSDIGNKSTLMHALCLMEHIHCNVPKNKYITKMQTLQDYAADAKLDLGKATANHALANELLSECLASDASNRAYLKAKGRALHRLGKAEAALAVFEQSLSFAPNDTEVRLFRLSTLCYLMQTASSPAETERWLEAAKASLADMRLTKRSKEKDLADYANCVFIIMRADPAAQPQSNMSMIPAVQVLLDKLEQPEMKLTNLSSSGSNLLSQARNMGKFFASAPDSKDDPTVVAIRNMCSALEAPVTIAQLQDNLRALCIPISPSNHPQVIKLYTYLMELRQSYNRHEDANFRTQIDKIVLALENAWTTVYGPRNMLLNMVEATNLFSANKLLPNPFLQPQTRYFTEDAFAMIAEPARYPNPLTDLAPTHPSVEHNYGLVAFYHHTGVGRTLLLNQAKDLHQILSPIMRKSQQERTPKEALLLQQCAQDITQGLLGAKEYPNMYQLYLNFYFIVKYFEPNMKSILEFMENIEDELIAKGFKPKINLKDYAATTLSRYAPRADKFNVASNTYQAQINNAGQYVRRAPAPTYANSN